MYTKIITTRLALFVIAAVILATGIIVSATVWSQGENPTTKAPAGPRPSQVISEKSRKIPTVSTAGDVNASVLSFIDFAGQAGVDRREEIRKSLAAIRNNKAAIDFFCVEAMNAQKEDHSRALLVLSLLGEIKSAEGGACLARFMKIPFPKTGTLVDGEIVEQTALGSLQAKAIDGLAYLRTRETDAIVLDAIKNHPSVIVRAEAIEAYLWNHRDNAPESRKTVSSIVRKGEEIYLDRVRRETGESKDSFNRKLNAFLKAHPEASPHKPERLKDHRQLKTEGRSRTTTPPKF